MIRLSWTKDGTPSLQAVGHFLIDRSSDLLIGRTRSVLHDHRGLSTSAAPACMVGYLRAPSPPEFRSHASQLSDDAPRNVGGPVTHRKCPKTKASAPFSSSGAVPSSSVKPANS